MIPLHWAAFAAVVCVVALPLLAVGAFLGRASERRRVRRGGLLELDTPAARLAITPEPDPDDWFDTDAFRARSRELGFEPFAGGGDQAA